MHGGPRQDATRNHLILSALRPSAYIARCPPPACGSAKENIDKAHRTRYREGRPQGRLSYFQPPASAWPFNSREAPLKSIPGPGEHGLSVLFKPTQSTIVFSITSPGAFATEYQVYHVNAGGFRRFSETEVMEATRELALHFVERAGPR